MEKAKSEKRKVKRCLRRARRKEKSEERRVKSEEAPAAGKVEIEYRRGVPTVGRCAQ